MAWPLRLVCGCLIAAKLQEFRARASVGEELTPLRG